MINGNRRGPKRLSSIDVQKGTLNVQELEKGKRCSSDSLAEIMASVQTLGLNEHHDGLLLNYLRFARFQRNRFVQAVESTFQEVKDTRLLDETFTLDEVEDFWSDLKSVVTGDVESELIATIHTNVLLLKQVFVQAQKWQLDLDADLDDLENRELLDQVKRWEDAELKDQSNGSQSCFIATSKKPPGKLAPISNSEAGPVQLLRNQILRLTDENKLLRGRITDLEEKALNILKEKDGNRSQGPEPSMTSSYSRKADPVQPNEVEELSEAFKQVKLKMANDLASNEHQKQQLEKDLVNTKQNLSDVQHQLTLAEKELGKKFSQTGAYNNLKKMLNQKNALIKDLRAKLSVYEVQETDESE